VGRQQRPISAAGPPPIARIHLVAAELASEWKQAPSEIFEVHDGSVDMRYRPSDRRRGERHDEHV